MTVRTTEGDASWPTPVASKAWQESGHRRSGCPPSVKWRWRRASGAPYNPDMGNAQTFAVDPCAVPRPQAEELRSAPVTSPTGSPEASIPAGPPLSELEFIGCKAVPMTCEQFRRYEGRLEIWDAETETAWMVREPTSADHESPSHGLAGLTALIAAVRGSPIACYGSMDLLVRDTRGKPRRIMQADQTVYLRPSRAEFSEAGARW